MSSGPVRWQAENAEEAATKVAGRPVHVFWPILRPNFRLVFLEPYRRAGSGTVAWRWSAPLVSPSPNAADLTRLRWRLSNALLDFTAALDRRDEDPSSKGGAREVHQAVETIVHALVQASDARLAAYAAWTEAGWMLHSWGFDHPSQAAPEEGDKKEDAEADPVASSVSTHAPVAEVNPQALEKSRKRRRRQKRLFMLFGVVAALVLLGWGTWAGVKGVRAERAKRDALIAGAAPVCLATVGGTRGMPSCSSAHSDKRVAIMQPKGGKMGGGVYVPGVWGGQDAPIEGRVAGVAGASSAAYRVVQGPARSEMAAADTSAKKADGAETDPFLAAFAGTMPTLEERKDDPAGPTSKLTGKDDPEPVMAASGGDAPSDEKPKEGAQGDGSSAKKDPTDGDKPSPSSAARPKTAGARDQASGLAQPAPTASAPPEQPAKEASDVEAKAAPTPQDPLSPLPGKKATKKEAPAPDGKAETPSAPSKPEAKNETAEQNPAAPPTPPPPVKKGKGPASTSGAPAPVVASNSNASSAEQVASSPSGGDEEKGRPEEAGKAPSSEGASSKNAPTPSIGRQGQAAGKPDGLEGEKMGDSGGGGVDGNGAGAEKPGAEASRDGLARRLSLTCRMGEWRIKRAQDEILFTLPTERGGAEALQQARERAWARARAMLPETFRAPLTRSGLSFRLGPGRAGAVPPKWLDAGTGHDMPGGVIGAEVARLDWPGRTPPADLDARLVSADGRELLRLTASSKDNRIDVRFGPEVLEVAPWFTVALAPSGAAGFPASLRWRSLGRIGTDARWETLRGEREISVICHPASTDISALKGGELALVHEPSGWELASSLTMELVEISQPNKL